MTAFLATTRDVVDCCHTAALANGGSCAGLPGLRPQYHAHYYGAYFRDPDGNKICVCCHKQPAHDFASGTEPEHQRICFDDEYWRSSRLKIVRMTAFREVFAAIADVHGNCVALEAVLADIACIGITEVVN
jgi:hypothetical protein